MCETGEGFHSEPGTPERMAELNEREKEYILQYGHQVNGIQADPMFYYTSGRCIFERPELLLTGNFEGRQAMGIINTLADLDNSGKIELASLATGEPVQLDEFGCPFKFIEVDPVECEMFGAINLGGPDILAIQVIWPDAQGRWPDDPDFAYGPDSQPIHN